MVQQSADQDYGGGHAFQQAKTIVDRCADSSATANLWEGGATALFNGFKIERT